MNRYISPLSSLISAAEVERLQATNRELSLEAGEQLIGMFENVKKVYYLLEGQVGFWVEDRYTTLHRLVQEAEERGYTPKVAPSDLVLSPEAEADFIFHVGDFLLFQHALYEQYLPFRVMCKTNVRVLEIDGNIFKSLFSGRLTLLRALTEVSYPTL